MYAVSNYHKLYEKQTVPLCWRIAENRPKKWLCAIEVYIGKYLGLVEADTFLFML